MSPFHDEDLVARLQRLGDIQPGDAATRGALERVRDMLGKQMAAPPAPRRSLLGRVAIAAGVLLLAGGLIAWLLPSGAPIHAAFADVQTAMQASKSMTCRQVTRVKGEVKETVRLFALASGLCRVERSDGGYTVMDTPKHRQLAVDPAKREAVLFEGVRTLPNFFEVVKNFPADASARPLPGKKLDGADVLGFSVRVQEHDLTVWADARTRLPVRIEAEDKEAQVVIDEFAYDKELDSKLFSLEPPAGYTLKTIGTTSFPDAPTDPKLNVLVATPRVGLGPVRFGMSRAEVEKLLGPPDSVDKVGNKGYVNMNYGSRGYFIGVSKTLGVLIISCVAQEVMATRVRDFTGKTDKGIVLGSSTADIIRAYGQPEQRETNQGSTYLTYRQLHVSFTLFSDRLVQLMLMRPR
jgi:outer membrane lipoprotein-sorting protein